MGGNSKPPQERGDLKMKRRAAVIVLALCLVSPLSGAQQSMSANAGLGPGNSFTLFITFEKPMPNLQSLSCAFQLQGAPRAGQEDFLRQLRCSGAPIKDDDTRFRIKVGDIPRTSRRATTKSLGLPWLLTARRHIHSKGRTCRTSRP